MQQFCLTRTFAKSERKARRQAAGAKRGGPSRNENVDCMLDCMLVLHSTIVRNCLPCEASYNKSVPDSGNIVENPIQKLYEKILHLKKLRTFLYT